MDSWMWIYFLLQIIRSSFCIAAVFTTAWQGQHYWYVKGSLMCGNSTVKLYDNLYVLGKACIQCMFNVYISLKPAIAMTKILGRPAWGKVDMQNL